MTPDTIKLPLRAADGSIYGADGLLLFTVTRQDTGESQELAEMLISLMTSHKAMVEAGHAFIRATAPAYGTVGPLEADHQARLVEHTRRLMKTALKGLHDPTL